MLEGKAARNTPLKTRKHMELLFKLCGLYNTDEQNEGISLFLCGNFEELNLIFIGLFVGAFMDSRGTQ